VYIHTVSECVQCSCGVEDGSGNKVSQVVLHNVEMKDVSCGVSVKRQGEREA